MSQCSQCLSSTQSYIFRFTLFRHQLSFRPHQLHQIFLLSVCVQLCMSSRNFTTHHKSPSVNLHLLKVSAQSGSVFDLTVVNSLVVSASLKTLLLLSSFKALMVFYDDEVFLLNSFQFLVFYGYRFEKYLVS